MIIKNMRWGYDGGGFACGPMEGSTYVETQVADENGKDMYILMSRMDEFCKVEVSEQPLFDMMMEAADLDNDIFDQVLAKVEKLRIENYDFERESDDPDDYDEEDEVPQGEELYDCPEMFEYRFAPAICLTLKAMDSCYELQEPTDEDARQFVEKYLGKDIDKLNFTL